MDINEFYKQITDEANQINITINNEKVEQFYKYMQILLEWNEKINLTAIKEEKEIITKHFIDSITISKYIKDNSYIADIGTGAGFPGIPLKIINDSYNITLVDSLNKRIKFLEEIITKLQLNKTKTIHARAEEIGKNKEYREKYDVVTSRAVADLSVLVEYMLPLVRVGGYCICMKGPDCEEEINKSKKAIKILGGKIEKQEQFELPKTNIKRTIVLIKKINTTPSKYPRKAGTPAKSPIT